MEAEIQKEIQNNRLIIVNAVWFLISIGLFFLIMNTNRKYEVMEQTKDAFKTDAIEARQEAHDTQILLSVTRLCAIKNGYARWEVQDLRILLKAIRNSSLLLLLILIIFLWTRRTRRNRDSKKCSRNNKGEIMEILFGILLLVFAIFTFSALCESDDGIEFFVRLVCLIVLVGSALLLIVPNKYEQCDHAQIIYVEKLPTERGES